MALSPLAAILDLKGNFSAQMKAAGTDATNFGGTIKNVGGQTAGAIGLITTGFAGMAGNVKSGFALLTGDYGELGNMLGQLPGPVGIVGKAIGDSLGAAMDETVKYTEAMRNASVKTGASVEFISQFTEAADDQFIAQDKVTGALDKFAKGLGGVQDMEGGFTQNGKGVAQVLDDMGIKATDANGKMLPMEDLIPQLADKFQAMGPGVKATALAVQLFGKQGADMLPVLLQGSAAMKQSMDAARDMGLSIDRDAVRAVTRLKQAQDALGDSATALGRKVSLAVIPALADEVEYLNSLSDWDAYLAYQNEHDLNPTMERGAEIFSAAKDAISGAAAAVQEMLPKAVDAATKQNALKDSVHTSSDAYLLYSDAVHTSEAAVAANTLATETAAAAQLALRDRTNEVISSIGKQTGVLDEAAQTQTIMELSTGKLSVAQFETETAVKAVMKALSEGKVTQLEAVRTMKGLADGTIKAEDAFGKAGHASDQLKGQMTYMEQVVAAASKDVGGLATNMNSLPADKHSNLTLTGITDPSFYAAKTDAENFRATDPVTKYIYGNKDSMQGVRNDVDGWRTTPGVTKDVFGRMDGTFVTAYGAYGSVVNGSATVTYRFDAQLHLAGYGMAANLAPAMTASPGAARTTSPAGNASSMVFQNNFSGGMSARVTAQMVQQAQRAAARNAMLRASIGG